MKILYLSCHSILEYDEVKLLTELGHEVFSPGAYVEPDNPGDASLRPGITSLNYNQDIVKQWHKIAGAHPGEDGKDFLTKDLVDNFDCVIVMHLPRWIKNNWEAIKHKRVIWRTIGQSITSTEHKLAPYRKQGLEIVRYSPMEKTGIPGFIGEDAVIRFYKDPKEYYGWKGHQKRVITFAQHMEQRNHACNFSLFELVTRPFNRHIFGPGNEKHAPWGSGKVPYEQLKEEMRNNRVYFYTGTHPASYTLSFMEAFMTGIPIVAIGPNHGNASYFPGHNLYEIPNMIKNGKNGLISDNPLELKSYIKILFDSPATAANISKAGRKSAIKYFGKEAIKKQWRAFLGQ